MIGRLFDSARSAGIGVSLGLTQPCSKAFRMCSAGALSIVGSGSIGSYPLRIFSSQPLWNCFGCRRLRPIADA